MAGGVDFRGPVAGVDGVELRTDIQAVGVEERAIEVVGQFGVGLRGDGAAVGEVVVDDVDLRMLG